jgi:hypothetical protein
MNERIRQLARQAGFDVERMEINHANGNPSMAEQFAELIIRDCMDVVDGYTKGRTFNTHYDAVEQIENLFGVKHERTGADHADHVAR